MRPRSALIRHDALVCRNNLRVALAGWANRFTLLLGVPVLLLMARAALGSLGEPMLFWLGAFGGITTGYALARLILARLRYHRTEGILAAPALEPGAALAYAGTAFTIGIVFVASAVACIALPAMAWFSIALPAGVIAGVMAGRMSSAGLAGWLPRGLGVWLDRPISGLVLAAPAVAIGAGSASTLSPSDVTSVTAVAAILCAIPLMHVDAAKVRFMAQCGHAAAGNVWREIAPLTIFIAATDTALLTMLGPTATLIVIALPVALLLAQPFRVLLYRAHGRRLADWLCTAMLAGLLFAAFAMPLAEPFAYLALLWWTAHSTRVARWRIA